MLAGDVCSRPPITIRSRDLHASDIRRAMGEITSYHERDWLSSTFLFLQVVSVLTFLWPSFLSPLQWFWPSIFYCIFVFVHLTPT